jgi:hypothetical protein
MRSKEQTPSAGVTNSKSLNRRKSSMSSARKFWPSKKKERTIEVPLSHAIVATEAHLRALSLINDNEDVTLEFTPDMVRINFNQTGGVSNK